MVNKKLLLVVLLCGSVAIGAAAISVAVAQEDAGDSSSTIDEALRADILKMLKLTGSDKLGEQVFKQMMASLKPLAPNVPEEFWTLLGQEFDMSGMIDLLIPVYAKHLTHEDVQAIIVFYETPAGRNLIAAQPKIVADSMVIGQRWGQEIAQKVMARLQEYQQAEQE
ncbi:hypothetical protein LCGC14_0451450 [marine sediment metagenome]|uniref:DUF2059 domain-containing protein n=1 Tax=marine sediment metagenome TaxID=412755 RepID=A0A0F9T0X5_9ZZZZ|nr:DUF2059 domain-containing protein [Phycisphaerae bacterium]HDZ44141.1 DUF2059 domain-containing protein [Phycisphaerae bacterium]